jgi:imidazolonepropionase-like amidohydrolase
MLTSSRSACWIGRALLGLSLALIALGSASSARAQSLDDLPAVTDTYALTDARVVQAPGQVTDPATVVVRDGVIDAVGPDVEVPFDAREIEGDSLVVYAGFIDGLSHVGIQMPESDGGNDGVDPGDPPMDRAGIQPDRSARSFLAPDDDALETLREVGFTTGHVVPEGEMLPGASALIQYGGTTPSAMVLEDGPTLFAQLETADGYVYPATEMAVIAKMKQLYREAERRQAIQRAYAQNPTGQKRPPQDPVHSAFAPVIDGETPLAFYADDALSIHRVFALQDELGFPLVLAGLAESHATLGALQETDAPLFLTLDLPDEPKRSADQDTTVADTTTTPSRFYDPQQETPTYEDVGEEEENLELRHAMERQDYLATAATLQEAGIEFGFTTREADAGDVRDNLRTMIEQGLSEDAALAALTTRPAAALGLDQRLGTVEEGKIANLVVTDGNYFAEDTNVEHVFVDGRLYDYSSDESEQGDVSGDVSAVVGTWSYTLETPGGERTGTLTFEGDASGLEGAITAQGEEQDLEAISFDGTTLSFTIPNEQGPDLSVTVTIEGDTFEGSVSTPGPTLSISGERTSTPDG